MKNIIILPVLAFVAIIAHAFNSDFTFAHAIGLFPFLAVIGYQMYLEDKVKPNYEEIFEQRLKEIDNTYQIKLTEIGKAADYKFTVMEKNFKELKENYGKISVEQAKKKPAEAFNFKF